MKASLQAKVEVFYDYNSKRRAMRKITDFLEDIKMNKLKHDYVHKVQIKRIFQGWRGILGQLRRKRILNESATLMRNNSLLEKSI